MKNKLCLLTLAALITSPSWAQQPTVSRPVVKLANSNQFYFVAAGETYEGIATKLGIDLAALRRLNNNSPLQAGRILKIPVPGAEARDQAAVESVNEIQVVEKPNPEEKSERERGRPDGDRKPTERGRPDGNRKPTERGRPDGDRKPAERGRPDGDRKPAERGRPDGDRKPAERGRPDGDRKPTERGRGRPDGDRRPTERGRPDGDRKPTERGRPDGDRKPTERGRPDGDRKPGERGEPERREGGPDVELRNFLRRLDERLSNMERRLQRLESAQRSRR